MPKRSKLSFAMRVYRIDQVIQQQGYVTFEQLMETLQCSAPTVKRDIRFMREQYGAPIYYDHKKGGYCYRVEEKHKSVPKIKLPDAESDADIPPPWFSATEMYVLLAVLQMCDKVENEKHGLLSGDMRALKARLLALVKADKISIRELKKRVKLLMPAVNLPDTPYFSVVGAALAEHRRLRITYFSRTRGAETAREISPLRLVNWRDRWYVDAWCHETEALKTFAIENIRFAEMSRYHCKTVSMRDIEAQLDSTYGIYSGGPTQTAVIEIDEVMTPYVKSTVWHEQQRVTFNDKGGMEVEIPYAKEPELAAEILRLGRHAVVKSPESLKQYILDELLNAASHYDGVKKRE